jgi:hypothetical protein
MILLCPPCCLRAMGDMCEGKVTSSNSDSDVVESSSLDNSVLFSIKYPFHGGKMSLLRKVLRESSIHLSRLSASEKSSLCP